MQAHLPPEPIARLFSVETGAHVPATSPRPTSRPHVTPSRPPLPVPPSRPFAARHLRVTPSRPPRPPVCHARVLVTSCVAPSRPCHVLVPVSRLGQFFVTSLSRPVSCPGQLCVTFPSLFRHVPVTSLSSPCHVLRRVPVTYSSRPRHVPVPVPVTSSRHLSAALSVASPSRPRLA